MTSFSLHTRTVRVQWDPERDIHHHPLEHQSIQIGLSREAIQHYVSNWIVNFEEITDEAKEIKALIDAGHYEAAIARLPDERPYELPLAIAEHVGSSSAAYTRRVNLELL